jgi:hypothetical protein
MEMEKNLKRLTNLLPLIKYKKLMNFKAPSLWSWNIETSIEFNLYILERMSFSWIARKKIGSLG